jgi:hypothetical protein
MRRRGYQLTRYADDWVVTCKSAAEARAAIQAARQILEQLGVQLHPQKTRVVQVQHGFEFLGYKIKRANRRLRLPAQKLSSHVTSGGLYAMPREKSIRRFMDQVRALTKRSVPLTTQELIDTNRRLSLQFKPREAGHRAQGLRLVPKLPQSRDQRGLDRVQGSKGAVGEGVLPQVLPEVFHRVEFRAVGGLVEQP